MVFKDPFNLITASVGGQGNVISSDLIGTACAEAGLKVTIGETHGLSQRGGSVISHIRISRTHQYGPIVPAGEVDLIQGFEPLEALKVFLKYGKAGTVVLLNTRPNYPMSVQSGLAEYPDVDKIILEMRSHGAVVIELEATELARQAGNPVAMNIVMVGAFAATDSIPVSKETYLTVMKNTFDEKRLGLNLKAFELGYNFIAETK